MDFNDYYSQQDRSRQAAQDENEIWKYNDRCDVIRHAIPLLLEAYSKKPPKLYEWIVLDGKNQVSWRLFREYDDTHRIDLLPDGRIVLVTGSYYVYTLPDCRENHVQKVIELRYITKVQTGELSAGDLQSIYHSILGRLADASIEYPDWWRRSYH